MSAIIHYDWINRNSLRSFPVQENSDINNELPLNIIADIRLLIYSSTFNESVYITSVFVSTYIITVILGTSSKALGSVTFKKNGGLVTEQIRPISSGVTGSVSCGTAFLNGANDFPLNNGLHNFETRLPIELRCITSIKNGLPITSISSISGDLISGNNAVVNFTGSIETKVEKYIDPQGLDSSMVTVSIAPQDMPSYISTCLSKAIAEAKCSKPIYKINSVSPNNDGVIFLEFINFENTVIIQPSTLNLIASGNIDAICVRPVVPDSNGLLPGESASPFYT